MKHRNKLTFGVRQYATMEYIYAMSVDGKSATLATIADFHNVSKAYAKQLVDAWVNAGFVHVDKYLHRKNAHGHFYSFDFTQTARYQKGYQSIARDALVVTRDHVRTERIDAIMLKGF